MALNQSEQLSWFNQSEASPNNAVTRFPAITTDCMVSFGLRLVLRVCRACCDWFYMIAIRDGSVVCKMLRVLFMHHRSNKNLWQCVTTSLPPFKFISFCFLFVIVLSFLVNV